MSKKSNKCDSIYQKYVKVTNEGVTPASNDYIDEDKSCNSGEQNVEVSDFERQIPSRSENGDLNFSLFSQCNLRNPIL